MTLTIPKITLSDIKKSPYAVLILITIFVAVFFINRNTTDCDRKDITIDNLNKQVLLERRAKDSVTSVLVNVIIQTSTNTQTLTDLRKTIIKKDSIINTKLKNPTKELIKEINKIK